MSLSSEHLEFEDRNISGPGRRPDSNDVERLSIFVRIPIALFVLALAWHVIAIAVADLTSTRSPRLALFFDPSHAKARLNSVKLMLRGDNPDYAIAQSELHVALRRDPFAPDVLTSLAKLAETQRLTEKANMIWPYAAHAARRDPEAQFGAMSIAIARADYTTVIRHLDALLRSLPGKSSQIVNPIAPLFENAKFRDVFVAALSSDPPWRASFFSALGQTQLSLRSMNSFYSHLKAAEVEIKTEELRPYLRRLVSGGFYEQAYLLWLSTLPEDRKPVGSLLYNADFRYSVSHMPFDWTFDPVRGVDINVERQAFNRTLKISFVHTRSKFENVRQILFLPPGAYIFSGRESADQLNNERGVRWRIRCMNARDGALGVSNSLSDTVPLRDFGVEFKVTQACPVQEILLEIPSRGEGEQMANGSVSYSQLLLQPKLK